MFLNTDSLSDQEIRLEIEKTVPGDPARDWLPAYHFSICDLSGKKIGNCDFRVGYNELTYYGGNIGYSIMEEFRGHHYAAKACRLLFSLAKRHGMDHLFISCNPENIPSRKSCEYAGGVLQEIAALPATNPMQLRGETHKCIYRIDLI